MFDYVSLTMNSLKYLVYYSLEDMLVPLIIISLEMGSWYRMGFAAVMFTCGDCPESVLSCIF